MDGRKGQVLTGCDVSSLVIDRLCYRGGRRNPTARCLRFSFAAGKEEPPTSMLVALPRQQIYGLGDPAGDIVSIPRPKTCRWRAATSACRCCEDAADGLFREAEIHASTLRMNVWRDIESRFLIRLVRWTVV